MPINYPDGIIAEHHHTRSRAGLCDVSHMGQVVVTGDEVAEQLESGGCPGGYPGAAVIHRQLVEGTVRKRVGLRVEGRRPARAVEILLDDYR